MAKNEAREKRLAAALRANLKRRKQGVAQKQKPTSKGLDEAKDDEKDPPSNT